MCQLIWVESRLRELAYLPTFFSVHRRWTMGSSLGLGTWASTPLALKGSLVSGVSFWAMSIWLIVPFTSVWAAIASLKVQVITSAAVTQSPTWTSSTISGSERPTSRKR